MSAVQEVLAVLLGAESEAKRIVGDAKKDAETVRRTPDMLGMDRERRMEAVREQAKGIISNAALAAETEAHQILSTGKEDRGRVKTRFDENVDAVVASVLAETVNSILSGGD
ncbi:ATP synthase F0 subunit B [Synergistales bacterium]|nr:ATP synthase F0 subunit B [Synergistales bacterium]